MNVNVHIERLVLDGISLPPDDRPMLQATIESELSLLIERQGWPTPGSNTHVDRVAANPVHINGPIDATSLGQQIAKSVHGGNVS